MKTQHKKAEYTLTPNEVQAVINATMNFRDRTILKSLYYTGMRAVEVAKLEVQDIDFVRKVIHIRESKRGKTRTIPVLDSHFLADLKHFIGKRDKDSVFGLSKRTIQHIVKQAGEQSGIKNPDPTAKHINCHLFRHSIARHLKSQRYPLEFIQKFLGHSSGQTTMDAYGTLSLHEMQLIVGKKTGDMTLIEQERALEGDY